MKISSMLAILLSAIIFIIDRLTQSNNAYMAQFPESGHGVFQFSQCARDIAVNFFKNPDTIPDMTCTKDLQTKFILP